LKQIKPADLSACLAALCNDFYDTQSNTLEALTNPISEESSLKQEKATFYQCSDCLTRYDKQYGDCVNDIKKEVEFENITDYKCPVCEAPKSEFSLIEANG
jgi:rubredoxin